MINLEEINNTIYELEHGSTTYDSCQKLASLYTVRDKLMNRDDIVDIVAEEYHDILPSYKSYIEIKKQYQMGCANKDSVLDKLQTVCIEIAEFLATLYSSTDMVEERIILQNLKNL